MGRDPALGVDAHHLDLGRAHQLAGHLAGGDHHRVGGHARALVEGVRLGDDAVGRHVHHRIGRRDRDQVVHLERLAVAQADLERLAARGLVAEHDPHVVAHAATASASATATSAGGAWSRRAASAARRTARRARRRSPIAAAHARLERRDRREVLGRARVAVRAPGEARQLGGGPVGQPRAPRPRPRARATSPRRIPAQPAHADARAGAGTS